MARYVYEFHLEHRGEDVFLLFPKLPEIHSAIDSGRFAGMDRADIFALAEDAVTTALQARISARSPIPASDEALARGVEGTVALSTLQSMKLEFYKLFLSSGHSLPEMAARMKKPETSIRRLLDLRHRSVPAEIDAAIAMFGKRLVTDLSLEPQISRVALKMKAHGGPAGFARDVPAGRQ